MGFRSRKHTTKRSICLTMRVQLSSARAEWTKEFLLLSRLRQLIWLSQLVS